MQHRTAAKRAIVLVLPAHRRPKMLVRRQADAVEIVVALAAGSNGTSGSRPRTRPSFQRIITISWMRRRRFRTIPTLSKRVGARAS